MYKLEDNVFWFGGGLFRRYGIVRCVFGIDSDRRSREELVVIQPYKLLASSFSPLGEISQNLVRNRW
jgi:hypothetical protein